MGQRNEDMDEVTLGPLSVHIDELTLLRDEIQDLKAECQEQREIIKLQARAFAESRRMPTFEAVLKQMVAKETEVLVLSIVKKLKAEGFFNSGE